MSVLDSRRERARIAVGVLGIAILIGLIPLVAGLLGALVMYVGVEPVFRRLAGRVPRRAAAVIVVVATALLILLPLAWLVMVAIDRAPEALSQFQQSPLLTRLAAVRIGDTDIGTRVIEASDAIASWVSSQAFRLIDGAVQGTINALVAMLGLYFLLLSTPESWREVASYLPFSAAGAELLARRFRLVTEATLLGMALTAALQGTVVALGFALTGLEDAWFWGVVTALVSVLPVLGSALVWVPGVAVLAGRGQFGAAAALAAIGFVVASNIDNVMRPLVNRRVSNLHPMVTLVGAFGGVRLLGLPGILLGPLAFTYFFELMRLYRTEYGGAPRGPAEPFVPQDDRMGRMDRKEEQTVER